MAAKSSRGGSWLAILFIVVAVAIWINDQRTANGPAEKPAVSRTSKPGNAPAAQAKAVETEGNYEIYRKCRLVENRGNDGDSFLVKLPDGREVQLRLYYVDTPESAFKTYRGGDTNHKRIADQAADLGGITTGQAVKLGQEAKHFTLGRLGAGPFDIFTRWDSPFNDGRFHAFIRVSEGNGGRWLHELLVEKGLVRIHTKGADLPDGTRYQTQKARLRELERAAKKAETGAWGL